jgi:hypothetical protein
MSDIPIHMARKGETYEQREAKTRILVNSR